MLRRLLRLPPTTNAQVDAELREEIESHIALGVEQLVRQGVSRDDAQRRVRARFGDLNHAMPTLYASARRRSMTKRRKDRVGAFGRDVVFAIRQFRRAPMLTAGVVLSLAFGIGASGTVFSWMEGTVLHPLPAVRDIDRLITLRPDARHGFGMSIAEFEEWRDQMRTVSNVVAASISLFAMQQNPAARGEASHPLYGMYVSAGYFEMLGVRTAIGRTFLPDDDRTGAAPVAILSDASWKQYFGATPRILGKEIRVNGQIVRVVGVAPSNFGGNLSVAAFDIWLPLHAHRQLHAGRADAWEKRDVRWLDVIGRLRDGVTVGQADAEIRAVAQRQAATFVENRGRSAQATPLDIGEGGQLMPLFMALSVVMVFVVLLICANVANLLLARATVRSRELAVRLSLGASRRRLIGQLMTESTLLAAVGAVLGFALAIGGHQILWLLVPETSVPIRPQWELNFRFLAFVVGLAVACVVAFGLTPALVGSRIDVVGALKNGARGSGTSKSRLRAHLVVAQFALALSALVCAAMFVRYDASVRSVDLGYRGGDHVLLLQTDMSLADYRDVGKWQRTLDLAVKRVDALPDVESAAVATFVPLGLGGYFRKELEIPGSRVQLSDADRVLVNGVSPGYFELMRIPIVEGRAITSDDRIGHRLVAVVNQAFAAQYFAGRSAIGQTIKLDGVEHTIVGVTPTGRYDYRRVETADMPIAYYAFEQQPWTFVTFHVRTKSDPLSAANAVRQAILSVDRTIPLFAPTTLQSYASVAFAISRSAVDVLTVLASAALLLASMGLFSVVSYGVALRTQEIGIRVALGATRAAIVRMFLRQALELAAVGSAVGLVVAAAFSMVMRSRIDRLPAGAPSEYVVPIVVLVVAAIAASFIPARGAAAVDPARTLRAD